MKTYSVPKEIDQLLADSDAMERIRDIYSKLPFGYRKAVRAAKEYERKKREFWQKLYALYPEIKTGRWEYRTYEMVITEKEEAEHEST